MRLTATFLTLASPARGSFGQKRLSPAKFLFFSGGLSLAQTSNIEWTHATWNPVTGCTKISPGCDHCYAALFAERFRNVPGHPFEWGFDLQLRPERLRQPDTWRKPRMIFVNSMSGLFQKEIPEAFVDSVFDTIERASWHTYKVLTKRSSLMRNWVNRRYRHKPVPPHIWLGVSVEDRQRVSHIQHLRQTNASVRFLSIEPLLGDVGPLDLEGIHWVIVGGESGPGARPMRPEWAMNVRDMCVAAGVPFFFKQWGAWGQDGRRRPKSTNGRLLEGRTWDQMPEAGRTGRAGRGDDMVGLSEVQPVALSR
jgi:protein gp37